MYFNEVFKIFNVSTLLAIYVFFNEKWLACSARAFFSAKFIKLLLVHFIPKCHLKKKKKKKQKNKRKKKKGQPHWPLGRLDGGQATPIPARWGVHIKKKKKKCN
jgi:hypothetical protein